MAIPGSSDPETNRDGDAWDAPTNGATPDHDGAPDYSSADAPRPAPQLSLGDEDVRLPWLESDDDEDEYDGGGGGQLIGLVLMGLLALLVIGGAVWWFANRGSGNELVADGGVIKAPAVPYKDKPANPGGKTFDGTGDTSFAVSEGQTRPARLGLAPSPSPAPAPSAPAAATPGAAPADTGGVGVQIAAYSNRAQAEAGWTRLSAQYSQLASARHRIVEGRADIGTVYRLQVVAADAAAAGALCRDLKAAGLACQVKN
ncbi:MAG: SPOR domain-containing protein [Novosphingobium sp.]|nr:SPOR domain-containing protein [Novosphingobium sp.]